MAIDPRYTLAGRIPHAQHLEAQVPIVTNSSANEYPQVFIAARYYDTQRPPALKAIQILVL